MITSRTVLILGAGASVPYGFPSGLGLLRQMARSLRHGNQGSRDLQAAGFSPDSIEDFRFALERSGRSSVDAFLEHRTEFSQIGKAAIAALLLPCETEDSLFDLERRGRWYEYLFQKLNAGFEDFAANRISFITFNYDRSLEYYLCTALKHAYGKPPFQVAAVVNQLPLIHVYGHLGLIPELDGSGPYGASPSNPTFLLAAAAEIRTIHDAPVDSLLARATELIESAERVFFLGFGFHETNLQRLRMPASCSQATLWGSAVGLTRSEAERIEALFGNRLELDWIHNDGLDALRHFTPLD